MPDITRREFLKFLGLLALAGCTRNIPTFTPTPVITPTQDDNVFRIPEGDYFNQLNYVLTEIKRRKLAEDLRDVYLGNVNDFDRDGTLVSRGSMGYTIGGKTTVVEFSIDPETGEMVRKEYEEERPEERIVEIFIPEYITNSVRNKKDRIRMLYLDSGRGHSFRKTFEQAGYAVEDSMHRLLPGIDIKFDQDVMSWNPDTDMYWGIVSGGIDPDKVQDGKFRLSDEYRYLLFVEDPLKLVLSNAPDRSVGFAHLYSNVSVVQLYKKNSNGGDNSVVHTALQEAGHMYGLPHCWEADCAMSRRPVLVTSDPSTTFGKRCLLIGENVVSGNILEIKDDNPRAYFESGRAVPEGEARRDLEEQLRTYFSDVLPRPLPEGLELQTTLGRKLDVVRLYNDGKLGMELEIPDFVGAIKTY